ncbi:type I restriction endonuclease subunit R [Haloarcula marismortui]|uniref:type I site-specific deoxyribonuclease n=1 Tax=Haloarcula marismortui ATCC 33800 TaxID=662476 RepID=M0JQ79_9EURY|nr:type I restriction endonuclease subunit R [Haloarcula sinaiiensis]EMA11297.1 type I site-specific deoxyribonuclease subunit rmeR [Haloarcula sinaiiensis ATCC 33800]QUJ73835.1 type I restriction endonuclease subunit R [Haloarcula sinaiiensis ATCC 33800]
MSRLPSEQGVEKSLLSWLDELGWETHGLDGLQGAAVLDERYSRSSADVVYWDLLVEQAINLNDAVTEDNVDRLVTVLRRDLDTDDLVAGNREFYKILTRGKQFQVEHADGSTEYIYVDLMDFQNLERNRFHAVNQFSVSRGTTIRPDVNLFVNGIPLVTMELKSLAQDNDYYDAISDLHNYEGDVPRLFVPGLFNVAADTTALRYGAVGAPTQFYMKWADASERFQSDNEMQKAVQALCNPATLLDMLKRFVFYDRRAGGDAKIVPRYMQYYAVNEILDRVAEGEPSPDPEGGTLDRGLIWHTQGSGKSFTMLYAAQNLLSRDLLATPQVFIIVDTDKLASQMRDTLSNIGFEQSVVAESIDHLQELIEQGKSQVVLTTIQKFQDVEPDSQGNDEVVVMSDEAHRFMEKDLSSRLKAALPKNFHFGFTGTPVREGEREEDRNTFDEFSPEGEDYLHRYSVKEGIEDGLILPVYFTLRHQMEWNVDEAGLDEEFEQQFAGLSTDEKREFIRNNITSRDLAELSPRVDRIVEEIDDHFEGVDKNGWKGMVVTSSRKSAAMYGERLIERLGEDAIEVLYTATGDDSDLVQQFHTENEERDQIVKQFKDEDEPKLLVVHNMLLTGFDAPNMKTMYLDRNLKNHTLMQAIARTNRVAEGKENGEIVDFQGVFENIDEALDYDTDTKEYAARDKAELFAELETQLDFVLDIFEDIPMDDSQETIDQCLAKVSTHPEKGDFKEGFRRLQNLYESVSPDARLIKEGIQDDYQWLARVYTAFQRHHNRSDRPEDAMREKTKEIIEEHVDVGEIKRDFPVYELGQEHLEAIEDMDPATAATNVAHATREHLQPKTGQNPKYKRLSERVNEIVGEWEQGDRSDPGAVEALKAVEEQVLAVDEEAGEQAKARAEFAIYTHLTDEMTDAVDSPEEAETIATDIVTEFDERVDRSYPGWETNQTTVQQIDTLLLDVLLKEHTRPELAKDERFMDALRRYLVQNYV